MKHIVSTALVLALFWLANSGSGASLLLGLGVLSVVFVLFLTQRMDVVDHESQPLHLVGKRLPQYLFWLSGEIISSNIQVVKLVWQGNKAISPSAGWIRLSQRTDVGKVIFANSITLTPGTVAMDLEGDRVYVHALTLQALKDVEGGEMDRRVTDVER